MCLYVFYRFERTYHALIISSSLDFRLFGHHSDSDIEIYWAQQWISSSWSSVPTCWTRLQDFLLVCSQLNRGQWRPVGLGRGIEPWIALGLWWICQCQMIALALEGEGSVGGMPFSLPWVISAHTPAWWAYWASTGATILYTHIIIYAQ